MSNDFAYEHQLMHQLCQAKLSLKQIIQSTEEIPTCCRAESGRVVVEPGPSLGGLGLQAPPARFNQAAHLTACNSAFSLKTTGHTSLREFGEGQLLGRAAPPVCREPHSNRAGVPTRARTRAGKQLYISGRIAFSSTAPCQQTAVGHHRTNGTVRL